MQKKLICTCFLFFCFFISNQIYSQINQGIVEYVVVVDNTSFLKRLNSIDATNESKEMLKSSFDAADEFRFIVSFDKEYSKSQGTATLENEKNDFSISSVKRLARGDDIVYTKLHKDSLLIQKPGYSNVLILATPLEWTLLSETKLINNRVCFKATSTKIVENSSGKQKVPITAWYTKEIPLPIGPSTYNGLPGLIIELTTNNGILNYRAEKISINQRKIKKIKIPSKNVILEEEADRIAKKNYLKIKGG